jgi:hypothetical protein
MPCWSHRFEHKLVWRHTDFFAAAAAAAAVFPPQLTLLYRSMGDAVLNAPLPTQVGLGLHVVRC